MTQLKVTRWLHQTPSLQVWSLLSATCRVFGSTDLHFPYLRERRTRQQVTWGRMGAPPLPHLGSTICGSFLGVAQPSSASQLAQFALFAMGQWGFPFPFRPTLVFPGCPWRPAFDLGSWRQPLGQSRRQQDLCRLAGPLCCWCGWGDPKQRREQGERYCPDYLRLLRDKEDPEDGLL